jgi:hypothetical protein
VMRAGHDMCVGHDVTIAVHDDARTAGLPIGHKAGAA